MIGVHAAFEVPNTSDGLIVMVQCACIPTYVHGNSPDWKRQAAAALDGQVQPMQLAAGPHPQPHAHPATLPPPTPHRRTTSTSCGASCASFLHRPRPATSASSQRRCSSRRPRSRPSKRQQALEASQGAAQQHELQALTGCGPHAIYAAVATAALVQTSATGRCHSYGPQASADQHV